MRRICLFAGYDINGYIDDYVVEYVKEMSNYADIYYLADCNMRSGELKKLGQYTISAKAYRHNKYDFGSWSEIIASIGWDKIEEYDELILVNDSQYLVGKLGPFLSEMEEKSLDFWAGLAVCEEYLGGKVSLSEFLSSINVFETSFTFVSSFLVLSRKLFSEDFIRHFFSNISRERTRLDVVNNYEIGLSRMILRHNVNYGVFIKDIYSQSSIYKNSAFYFITLGYPLIKIKVFVNQYYPIIAPLERLEFLKYYNPNLNLEILKRHINRMRKGDRIRRTVYSKTPLKFTKLANLLIRFILKLIYEISPKFLANPYKRLFDWFHKYWGESKYAKSRIGYFISLVSTRPQQSRVLKSLKSKEKLIIYFNVSRDVVSGGMLSINRFADKTRKLPLLNEYSVIISGIPLHNPPVNYSYFVESSPQIKFSNIVRFCNPEEVIIHIPETLVFTFFVGLTASEKEWLVKIPKLQINILNQNNDLMQDRAVVRNLLAEITENITITTAHESYCSQYLANKYSAPVHQLTPFLPTFYNKEFKDKEKMILYSNDNNISNSQNITKLLIIDKLKNGLPDYRILEINNMTLEEYKSLISSAMFVITFGEGFDGYFIEAILSNSISFAVYNPKFFPPEFIGCENVYENWNELFENIVDDILKFSSDESNYQSIQSKNEKLIKKHISDERSYKELERFYLQEYDFIPMPIKHNLFENIKEELGKNNGFSFFGGNSTDEYVLAPDGTVYINMRGEFYSVLYEIYVEEFYKVDFEDNFILIDVGFHVGISSLYMLKKYSNLKRIYGFEPMRTNFDIGLRNFDNNHIDSNLYSVKMIGLSNEYLLKSFPYIPDWSSGMSVENTFYYYEMYSSTEMMEQISYSEAEIVPAHTELKDIIENAPIKVVLKCDVQGSEFKIFEDLDEYGLLRKIDQVMIETHKDDPEPIISSLVRNGFKVDDKLVYQPNNIHNIVGIKAKEMNEL